MSDVYVVGVDMTKFAKAGSTRSVSELGARAALMALDDAGLKIQQMEALYCGNLYQASAMVGQRILQEIGQTGIPVVNVANACATGATAFREAWMAIKAGVYDVAIAVGVEVMGKGLLGGGGGGGGIPKEGLLGSATMPAVFAEAGMEHARKYGTTFEQFAKVSVKNHHHSTMNPKAMYQIETPLEMVMNAEMIAYPNTKLMCSVNVDGAASAVLCSERKVKELGLGKRAVRVRASALASDPWQERDLVMPDVNTCTRLAAKKAYEMAGCGAAGHQPGRAARLLRDRGDPALREPRPLQGRRGRPHDRHRRGRARRPGPGERLGRAALEGPPARRDGHRQHLRGLHAPARRGGRAAGPGRAASA